MKLNILGTEYMVIFDKEETNKHIVNCDGYCDFTTKKIYIRDDLVEQGYEHENLTEFQNRCLRHEIVHAFMYESGLDTSSEWGRNETLIDWIAIQIPKMSKVMEGYL